MNTAKTRARPHHASDPVTCSCHQGAFDPGVSEWMLRDFRVTLEDDEGFAFSVIVRASGERDAVNQARLDHPGCVDKRVVAA
jgi:hypothetical protein